MGFRTLSSHRSPVFLSRYLKKSPVLFLLNVNVTSVTRLPPSIPKVVTSLLSLKGQNHIGHQSSSLVTQSNHQSSFFKTLLDYCFVLKCLSNTFNSIQAVPRAVSSILLTVKQNFPYNFRLITTSKDLENAAGCNLVPRGISVFKMVSGDSLLRSRLS